MDLDLHKMTQTLIFWIFLIKSTTKNGSPRHTVPHPTTAQKHSSQQGPSRRGECKVSKGQELNLPPPPLGLAASLPDLLSALPPPLQVALEDNQPGISPKNSASLTLRWQRTLQVTGIQIAVCCSRVVRTRWMQMSWIICTQNKAPHLKKILADWSMSTVVQSGWWGAWAMNCWESWRKMQKVEACLQIPAELSHKKYKKLAPCILRKQN